MRRNRWQKDTLNLQGKKAGLVLPFLPTVTSRLMRIKTFGCPSCSSYQRTAIRNTNGPHAIHDGTSRRTEFHNRGRYPRPPVRIERCSTVLPCTLVNQGVDMVVHPQLGAAGISTRVRSTPTKTIPYRPALASGEVLPSTECSQHRCPNIFFSPCLIMLDHASALVRIIFNQSGCIIKQSYAPR